MERQGRRKNAMAKSRKQDSGCAGVGYGGFTIIEMMIVLLIIGVLAALAAPSYSDYISKKRLTQAAEGIYALVLQAKAEGPARDSNIFLDVEPGTTWCVGYTSKASCDCTKIDIADTDACVVDVAGSNVLQVVNAGEFSSVSTTTSFGGGTTFSLPRNFPTAGSIVATSGEWELKLVLSTLGRLKLCNPNDNSIPGYKSC